MGCYTIAISPDGTRLASGGLDGNVKIWDPKLALQYVDETTSLTSTNKRKKPNQPEKSVPKKLVAECRALCTMSRHNGAVTCVKFSPNGRFLATGSDDKIVLIWEKDEEQGNRPKQFGDTEADLEHWTVRKRLVAHDNDVQDIAWSPDGALLVTVGLDRLIIIWSGNTFERIKRYDIHQSMVKGIVFDPANKFFATASDDRSVRIFRYYRKHPLSGEHEFQMEHTVVEPFKKSPLTSYFRRMSWSPDGQHIAVPNATNGPVTSVAIINRGLWVTDISLIGHEAPCEVCSFAPRLFQNKKGSKDNFATILATGGQDLALVIWSTAASKPLLVASDIVKDSITDICWTPDGKTLFVSCLDGSITCVDFAKEELGYVVAEDINDLQLNRYGTDRESTVFAENIQQLELEEKAIAREVEEDQKVEEVLIQERKGKVRVPEITTNIVGPTPTAAAAIAKPINGTSSNKPNQLTKLTQNVTVTKDGKKRVAPLLVSSARPSSAPVSLTSTSSSSLGLSSSMRRFQMTSKLSRTSYILPRIGLQTTVQGLKSRNVPNSLHQPLDENNEDNDNDNEDMGIMEDNVGGESNNGALVSESTLRKHRNKLKRQVMEERYPSYFKLVSNIPEVLFHHPNVINATIGKTSTAADIPIDMNIASTYDTSDEDLVFSVLVNGVTSQTINIEGGDKKPVTTTIEIRNCPSWNSEDDEFLDYIHNDRIDFQDPTMVIVSNDRSDEMRQYSLYFPFKIQHSVPIVLRGVLRYYGLISFSGTLQFIRADTGTIASPSIELGANAVVIRQSGEYFTCVTSDGLIYGWKLPSQVYEPIRGSLRGVPLASIWNGETTIEGSTNNKRNGGDISYASIPNIRAFEVDPETGTPYVMFEGPGDVFCYSMDMMCWTTCIDSWYFQGAGLQDDEWIFKCKSAFIKRLLLKAHGSYKSMAKRGNKKVYEGEFPELMKIMRVRHQELIDM